MIKPSLASGLQSQLTRQETDLLVISTLALFFELMLIRWIPSMVQVVAYFTNFVLLCSFVGLGAGCLVRENSSGLMRFFPILLLALVGIAEGFAWMPIAVNTPSEHFLGFYVEGGRPFFLVLLVMGVFIIASFMLVGQALGAAFRGLPPLRAYSLNILGSLIGTVFFTILAAAQTEPFLWMVVVILMSFRFIGWNRRLGSAGILCFVLTLWLVGGSSSGQIWSPYSRIDLSRQVDDEGQLIGFKVVANQMFHQNALDLSKPDSPNPLLRYANTIYRFPYKQGKATKDVLVIGAGSGNDVTVALQEGAERVDAVEIDPVIAGLGRWLHPQKPYKDPRVHLINDDARAYLNRTDRQYDLIAFGYLDSHRVFSSFSSVRMDNFIYTRESFEAAKRCLKPGGRLVVTYLVFQDWVVARLEKELRSVFGNESVATYIAHMYESNDTVVFVAGEDAGKGPAAIGDLVTTDYFQKIPIQQAVDDWPYLYLRERGIPAHYFWILAGLLLLSGVAVMVASPDAWVKGKEYPVFFWLGAAFMLLETKAITRSSVLYGSTWVVSAVVIGAILCTILVANILAGRLKLGALKWIYLCLLIALLAEWLIGPAACLSLSRVLRFSASGLLVSLPLFFAGLIFALCFRDVQDTPAALAANLMGAIVGGVLEYSAMLTGFGALTWIALVLYGLSYGFVRKKWKSI